MRTAMVALCAALGALQTSPAAGLRAPVADLAEARDAWDRGAYPDALQRLRALTGSADDATLAQIALLTGELYETAEITANGRRTALLGDTGRVMYETVVGGVRLTRIVEPGGRLVAEFPGGDAVASPDGRRVAYRLDDERVAWREVGAGTEAIVDAGALTIAGPVWSPDGSELIFTSPAASSGGTHGIHAYRVGDGTTRALAVTPVPAHSLRAVPDVVLYALGGGRNNPPAVQGFVDRANGRTGTFAGALEPPVFSADGRTVAYAAQDGPQFRLFAYAWGQPPVEALSTTDPIAGVALSPDGSRVAFQRMLREDWEIFVLDRPAGALTRVTREIQHDVLPRFLSNDRLLGLVGERRHRRSYLYDLTAGTSERLFHNNTVRTIAPEYEWDADGSGMRVLIQADRDGDTVSPERGVYLVDLSRRVTRQAIAARLDRMLEAERALRAYAERVTKPLAPAIRAVLDRVSTSRIYSYERALYAFDSKHISQPGNGRASAYLRNAYASFGYAPEYQWFSPPGALGGRTANVVATLRGTQHPDVVYVVGSHYDSEVGVPGADDNSSGTAALLETARVLAGHPQPATIVFASFTGEEEGALGSRHFAETAAKAGWQIAGALNNDMIGWANDHRLDDTIRYSNDGIRDIQHAVALRFTDLVTYDARYYRGTDAAAFYEAWGDIVGGLGSYPVLGSPHYHRPHDVLETINHQLVAEVAKTTAATLVMLTNMPARVRDLAAERSAGGIAVTWKASPESDVRRYRVEWTSPAGRARQAVVTSPSATIPAAAADSEVLVTAVNARGLESWDRARVRVP